MLEKHYDIIIVGAGIAGLHAARELVKAGVQSILVLEKNARVGGRIQTIRGRLGTTRYQYEAGAGRISKKHTNMMRLVKELGLHLQPISHSGYEYKGDGKSSNPNARALFEKLIRKVFDKSSTMSKEALQSMSFKTLCEKTIGRTNFLLAKSIFGYNAEFEIVNAYDGLRMFKRDFAGNSKYYVIREGFDAITDNLASLLRDSGHVKIRTRCTVLNVDKSPNPCVVYKTRINDKIVRRSVTCGMVICALPKPALMRLFRSPKEHALLNSVAPVSLNRMYGFLDPKWLTGRPVTTTDGRIRQFIPVRSDIGLAMVSYSDTEDADYWQGRGSNRNDVLKHDLRMLFGPGLYTTPEHITNHYWNAGVHMWLPGYDSVRMTRAVMRIRGPDAPVYVVGEAYSNEQGWAEGALRSVNLLLGTLT